MSVHVTVHGGAGSPPERPPERQHTLDRAAEEGAAAADPAAAVVAAVRVLEGDPQFNAGTGSVPQSDGVIRTDAGLMRGDRTAGAACAMPGVEAAIEVARLVAVETPHVMVSGVHAVDLADAFGVDTGLDLWTDRQRDRWRELGDHPPIDDVPAQLARTHDRFCDDRDGRPAAHDTVGAVAADGDRVAAATSTGGRWLALAGRVGDVPQVGSGFYAGPAGAASATGAGEDIARTTLSRRAVDLLAEGHDAATAVDTALAAFEDATGSTAGLVAVTPDCDAGVAYNSEAMQTSSAGGD